MEYLRGAEELFPSKGNSVCGGFSDLTQRLGEPSESILLNRLLQQASTKCGTGLPSLSPQVTLGGTGYF